LGRADSPGPLVQRSATPIKFDRHDAQHVFPVGLVLQDLPEFGLGASRVRKKSSVSRRDREEVRAQINIIRFFQPTTGIPADLAEDRISGTTSQLRTASL
jgi:hypothetical protein